MDSSQTGFLTTAASLEHQRFLQPVLRLANRNPNLIVYANAYWPKHLILNALKNDNGMWLPFREEIIGSRREQRPKFPFFEVPVL